MGRDIEPTDGYAKSLVKLIPSEIIAAYTALIGTMKVDTDFGFTIIQSETFTTYILLGIIIFMAILNPLYLMKIEMSSKKLQKLFSTVGFVIWAYTLGGYFEAQGIYYPILGTIMLTCYTLLIPLFFVKKINPSLKGLFS